MPSKHRIIGLAGSLALLVAVIGSASAFDSTSTPHPSVPWQLPNARALGGVANCPTGQVVGWMGSGWGCTNTVANSSNATYASNSNYASGAGSANYATGAGSSNLLDRPAAGLNQANRFPSKFFGERPHS